MTTSALTSVGIQYVSISIGATNTSGTATISAVGSGAYIIWLGQKFSTSSTSETTGLGRVELTNSTTVTAYRNSAGNTLTVNALVVDGDTTNLVKSVQKGTLAFAGSNTTKTATISAVTNNNTVINYPGLTSASNATDQLQIFQVRLSLSGTTVTGARNTSTSNALTVGYQVVEFQGTALNSAVQNVQQTATSGTSNDNSISSVTTANTWIANGNNFSNTSTSVNAFWPNVKLKDSTHTTMATNGDPGGGTVGANYCVCEFVSGVLTANAVQRGTVSLSAATSGTLTITSVTQAQAAQNWLGNTSNISNMNEETLYYLSAFTNSTTLTVSNTASVTGIGSLEIIEFNPAASGSVATWSAAASLAAVGSKLNSQAATWSASASFAAHGASKAAGVATWSAATSLSAHGAAAIKSVATWSAAASLSAVGSSKAAGHATFSSAAALAGVTAATKNSVATFSPATSLSAARAVIDSQPATWSATASLSAVGSSLAASIADFAAGSVVNWASGTSPSTTEFYRFHLGGKRHRIYPIYSP